MYSNPVLYSISALNKSDITDRKAKMTDSLRSMKSISKKTVSKNIPKMGGDETDESDYQLNTVQKKIDFSRNIPRVIVTKTREVPKIPSSPVNSFSVLPAIANSFYF